MRAEYLSVGDVIDIGGSRLTVVEHKIATVVLSDGVVLPRTAEVNVVSFINEEQEI